MKSFRKVLPVFGVVAMLAGCSGPEGTNTGVASSPISATSTTGRPTREGRPHAGRPHHGPGGPELLVFAALHENIGLSTEQRSAIEALVGKGGPGGPKEGRPAPNQAKTAELAAAIRSGNVDAAKLAPPNGDGARMAEHQAKSAEKLATLHETLTKEQRAALVDAIAAKMPERGPEGDRPEGRPERRHDGGPLLEGLDLTQAQRDQIKAKLEADRPAPPTEADRAAMKQAMDAKLQSFKADSFDANAFVTPPAGAPKMGGPADPMARELSVIVSVLTSEQREKLAQRIEQGPPARR